MSHRFRMRYGASPGHLLAVAVALVPAAYVVLRLLGDPMLPTILLWFVGAAVVHDLVLFPLYTLADQALRPLRPPLRNHVRIPVLGSALLLLVFFPGVLRQGAATFGPATGLTQEPFAGRWLLLSAAMFAASALVYVVRKPDGGRPRNSAGQPQRRGGR